MMTLALLWVAALRMFFSDLIIVRLEDVVLRPSGLLEVSMFRMDIAESLSVRLLADIRFWARSLQSLDPAITATTVFAVAAFQAETIIFSN